MISSRRPGGKSSLVRYTIDGYTNGKGGAGLTACMGREGRVFFFLCDSNNFCVVESVPVHG